MSSGKCLEVQRPFCVTCCQLTDVLTSAVAAQAGSSHWLPFLGLVPHPAFLLCLGSWVSVCLGICCLQLHCRTCSSLLGKYCFYAQIWGDQAGIEQESVWG